MKRPWFLRGIPQYVVVGALPQPPHIRFSSPGKGLLHHPASVPFRKFDEEVLRTLRGLRPHPVRPLRGCYAWPGALPLDTGTVRPAAPCGCAREARRPPSPRPGSRAHARGSPPGSCRRHSRQWRRGPPLPALRCAQRSASVATGGSARGGSQGGGGPKAPRLLQNLTPPPARLPPGNAHTRRGRPSASLRAAARGSGVGVEDDHGRSACSRGAAVKLHVEITSRS